MSRGQSLACTYTVVEDWNGKLAHVRIPVPGLSEERKAEYDKALVIADKVSGIRGASGRS